MKGYSIEELTIGQTETFTKTVTESDVYGFAGITGDFNPAHVDEASASQTQFGHRIAHGMLSVGFISAILGTKLPGPGSIYMGQEVKFLKPVYFGDTVTAKVTVKEIIAEKNRVILETTCSNQKDELLISGTATIYIPAK